MANEMNALKICSSTFSGHKSSSCKTRLFASKSIPASARFGDGLEVPKLRDLKSHSFLSSWTNSHENLAKDASSSTSTSTSSSATTNDSSVVISATTVTSKRDDDVARHLQFKDDAVDAAVARKESTDQRRKSWLQGNRTNSG